ncbi:MAG: hypothetical protein IJP46_06090, partial [Prevotella sp.]|nr:hypothetical protein [Prevotella sp.]
VDRPLNSPFPVRSAKTSANSRLWGTNGTTMQRYKIFLTNARKNAGILTTKVFFIADKILSLVGRAYV